MKGKLKTKIKYVLCTVAPILLIGGLLVAIGVAGARNTYKDKKRLTEISLDIFEGNGNSYNRFSEQFCERAYTAAEIEKALLAAGLKIEAVYDENSFDEPKNDTQRVVYVTRKV